LSATSWAEDEPSGELVPLVINLLGEQDKDLRALGLEQVRTAAKGQAATRQFAAQLPKLPPDAQVGLLAALADRGDGAARPAVWDILASSRNEPVRVAAIEAIGRLGEPTDLPLLMRLLREAAPDEKAAARTSLTRLPGESVPTAIAAEMKRAAAPLRVTLIEILAARRAAATVPDLLAAAGDADPAVRTAAMNALGQLAGPEHLPGLVQGVLKAAAGREREAAEKCVMAVCGRIEDAENRAAPLLAAMDKLNTADRLAMLSTLGRVGGPAAHKAIEAAIADPNPQSHDLGIRALSNWPDATIAPRLRELAKTDPHPAHRRAALRALIRVAPLPDKRSDIERLELLRTAMTMCEQDAERLLVLDRCQAVRIPQTLRFLTPYLDQPAYAQQACLSVVELAHHRTLRQPNKAEFDPALDKVIQISQDPIVRDRAQRYKNDQTWVRPAKP
jgi:HEAT repeat protein